MDYKLTRLERETIITFNEAEPDAEIYTASKTMMRKLDKLMSQTDVIRMVKEDEVSKTYICPKKLIKVRKPRLYGGFKANFGVSEE